MAKVMVTLQSPGGAPTIEGLVRKYQLAPGQIDADFGVVEIDPNDHTYTLLVEPEAAARISGASPGTVSGPYSNPQIGTFGLKSRPGD